ncbi:unnamed protein product [Miscanthus lutarioriparius]|uniref:TF-B3 domain-containing protein n=1 Tax=Miscanthus lutarioriparius TaxID=422564 RepID=A0A811QAU3_9POAL|nr:unnamed protein product [Miscanthus lutarioriparius]
MRGRPKKQQGTTSSAAKPVKERESGKEKEKEARKEPAKEKEASKETGREAARGRPRRKGKETEMGGDGKEPATEKQKKAQRKGKDKETEVIEDGEQNDKENVCPQFFKVFFPEQSGERLKIPPMFHQHLKEQPTGPVSLKGPSGKKWQATIASESEVWSFEQGWKEFVTDHSLKKGYFLVFTYDGPSQFSVAVFSPSGIIDPAAMDAKPTNEVVVKIEEDEGVQGDMDAGGASEVSILPTEEGNAVTGRRTRAMRGGATEIPPLPTEEGHGVTGKRTRAMCDLPADANASKRHSTVSKKADKRRSQAGTSKDVPPIVHNATFSLLDESKTFNKTQIRDKNVPRSGKFLLKTSRAPVVISQRRPVTEEEKDLALRKANEFKSKYPFTVQIMMESYVYVGFFMKIACEFVRESLPPTNKKITLWDPLGKAWEVNYVYYSDRSVGAFSGGWGKFALGNNLEKFDVCIFELFKEDNIKVHIYRVVPEITPLLRARNRD